MTSVAELAMQYGVSSELIMNTISQRMAGSDGTSEGLIHGRLEGGLLYTPAYLRNVKAQLRGALRGGAQPLSVPALVKVGGCGV
jgi:hypothetical protein